MYEQNGCEKTQEFWEKQTDDGFLSQDTVYPPQQLTSTASRTPRSKGRAWPVAAHASDQADGPHSPTQDHRVHAGAGGGTVRPE